MLGTHVTVEFFEFGALGFTRMVARAHATRLLVPRLAQRPQGEVALLIRLSAARGLGGAAAAAAPPPALWAGRAGAGQLGGARRP